MPDCVRDLKAPTEKADYPSIPTSEHYLIIGFYVNFGAGSRQRWTFATGWREEVLNHLAIRWIERNLFNRRISSRRCLRGRLLLFGLRPFVTSGGLRSRRYDALIDAVVYIPRGDPGFAWLFAHPIAGLITAWEASLMTCNDWSYGRSDLPFHFLMLKLFR
jgi:hypothetical protein